MDEMNFEIPINSKVKLKDSIDGTLYGGLACAGNQGWIRGRQKDPKFGYPQVFVEWDMDHWAYNGLDNVWTFESHFDIVEEAMENKEDKIKELVTNFTRGLVDAVKEEISEPTPSKDTEDAEYSAKVREIAKHLEGTDALIVLSLTQGKDDLIVPTTFTLSKDDKLGVILNLHIAYMAAQNAEDLTRKVLDGAEFERV
jgi:hypothetical protein